MTAIYARFLPCGRGRPERAASDVNKRSKGTGYEKLAASWLRSLGYRIICSNFRCRFGEIDIVAEECGVLVFAEVKYRRSGVSGTPEEAVDRHKQIRICRTADWFMSAYRISPDRACRFDVIAVGSTGMKLRRNAFSYIPAGR